MAATGHGFHQIKRRSLLCKYSRCKDRVVAGPGHLWRDIACLFPCDAYPYFAGKKSATGEGDTVPVRLDARCWLLDTGY